MIDNTQFENKKAAYFTLGCKLNFAETSTIGRELANLGIRKVRPGEKADICVINTCSVTELADKKCRQAIRRLSKQHPGSLMIVTGCYAQLKPEEVANIEGVNLVLGADQKLDLPKHLEQLNNNRESQNNGLVITSKTPSIKRFMPSCSSDDRTRHFLKVQDGCDYFCSYCTIPFARGRSRNGSITELTEQAKAVSSKGGKEIVLTGVNIGDFGKTTHEEFLDLLQALDNVKGIERYRISSLEPDLISDELIEWVAQSKHFVPHFHMPLQSGSDAVLKLMRRKYNAQLFADKVLKIKELMPDAFIGVDVIVGTRGETIEYFMETENLLESLPVSQLHVFSYSERPGTQALKITPIVSPQDKQMRSQRLLDLSDRKLHQFYNSFMNEKRTVLFEHARKGNAMLGFTDNYIRVQIPYDKSKANQLIPIILKEYNEDKTAILGELIQ